MSGGRTATPNTFPAAGQLPRRNDQTMTTLDYRGNSLSLPGALPSPIYNNTYGPTRSSRYGEQYVQPIMGWRAACALEGTYFAAHNATDDAATTLAGHAAPVLADADATMTKPFIFLRNPSASTSALRLFLDYIEIEVITAAASGTQACYSAQIDSGATRYSSGGTALTIVNPNQQSSNASVLAATSCLMGGAVVSAAETAAVRYLQHGSLRPTIEIAGDKKLFVFGQDPLGLTATAGATVREQVVNLPPVILGPTDSFLLALYGASTASAGVYKVRMGWVER